MVQRIDDYPIPSGIVEMSAVASVVNGQVSTVDTWIVSQDELLPTAADFIQNNDLLSEITSQAGIDEETAYSSINQVSYTIVDGLHSYTLSLVVTNG